VKALMLDPTRVGFLTCDANLDKNKQTKTNKQNNNKNKKTNKQKKPIHVECLR